MLGSYSVPDLVLNAENMYYRGQLFLPSWHSQSSGGTEVNRQLKLALCILGWGRCGRGT